MDTKRIPISINQQAPQAQQQQADISTLSSDFPSPFNRQSDLREKMNQRMREFEDESRKWREQFMSNSNPLSDHRPRMLLNNFPDFPEFGSLSSRSMFGNNPTSAIATTLPTSTQTTTHKSFIEEDDNGNKKYKIQFEIGDFKPNELQVKTEGRLLVVKGDREINAGSQTESKQFNREITLPEFIEPTSVTSFLVDGVLTVEAPVIMERFSINNGSNSVSSASSLFGRPFRDTISPSRSLMRGHQAAQRDDFGLFSDHSLSSNNSQSNTTQSPSIGTITSANASFKFNMSEFRPEDISITVTDTTLKIHAVRDEHEPSGKSYREFKREIGLPQGADVKRLKNSLLADGTLIVEIPVNDNQTLRPPPSPTGFSKQFANNFALNDATSKQQQQQQQQQQLQHEKINYGEKELKITFDLSGYRPEDINIKVTDNTLKVNAIHIDNTKGNQIHREYSRSYILPEWVNAELLRARMSDNGTLTVEVPLPQGKPNQVERAIKIQQF